MLGAFKLIPDLRVNMIQIIVRVVHVWAVVTKLVTSLIATDYKLWRGGITDCTTDLFHTLPNHSSEMTRDTNTVVSTPVRKVFCAVPAVVHLVVPHRNRIGGTHYTRAPSKIFGRSSRW